MNFDSMAYQLARLLDHGQHSRQWNGIIQLLILDQPRPVIPAIYSAGQQRLDQWLDGCKKPVLFATTDCKIAFISCC